MSIAASDTSNRALRALLKREGACSAPRKWIGNRDMVTAWAECPDGSWMLWLAARVGVARHMVVRSAARCAETALQFVPAGDDRPRLCIEATLRWCDEPSPENLERLREARRNAAVYAAYAAYAADATDAAAAAVYAAYAAYAADAAVYAADATYADATAYAAAYAAADAAYAADATDASAWRESLRESAQIVRRMIPLATVLAAAGIEATP